MEIKKERPKPQSNSFIAEALTMRIQALVHLIKSDVIRAAISAKLGEVKDIKALYQLLSLAQASIENSELIENKVKSDLVFNLFTGELISEIDCMPAAFIVRDMLLEIGENKAPKNNPKPKVV